MLGYVVVDLFLILCLYVVFCFFFFKQKTAYEMRISDWSSDVCSSDLFTKHAGEKLEGLVAKIEPRFNSKFGHFCRRGRTDAVEAADVEFGHDFRSPPRSNDRLTVGLVVARSKFCEKLVI